MNVQEAREFFRQLRYELEMAQRLSYRVNSGLEAEEASFREAAKSARRIAEELK